MNASMNNMYNSDIPSRAELPSTRQLIRSTIIAAVSAAILLFTVVLPSEYGVDPTGIGKALGLTEMGEIKTRLTKEAAEDAAATKASLAASSPSAVQTQQETTATTPPAAAAPVATPSAPGAAATKSSTQWRDEMTVTLKPGQGTEIKLKMKEGEMALYSWAVQGGVVNFDTHGDAIGKSISYEKGRAVASDEGELVAAFTGNHGWYWRNRGPSDVKVVLRTRGQYTDIKQVQ